MIDFEVFMTENMTNMFSSIISWVFQIFDATNTVGIFVTAVGIYLVVHFLIMPLRGHRGSDKAKGKGKSKADSDGE